MGRKRKAGDGEKMAGKSKTPKSDKSEGEEKEHSESAQSTSESKDDENNKHSPSNNLFLVPANEIEHIMESENLVEKEKEEPNSCQKVGTEPSLDERNMEQKVCRTTNAEPSSKLSHKSRYISSQKQVEYLMAENCRLSMKLEFAHGKIEAYEKVNDAIHMTKGAMLNDLVRGKTLENAIRNVDSAPDADTRQASREKIDSKKASNIAKDQKKVYRLRSKNC